MVTAWSLAVPWCSAPRLVCRDDPSLYPRSKLNCSMLQQVLLRRFCQYPYITPSNHLLFFLHWSSPIPLATYSGLNHRKCSRREAACAHHTTHDDFPSTKCTQMLFRSSNFAYLCSTACKVLQQLDQEMSTLDVSS